MGAHLVPRGCCEGDARRGGAAIAGVAHHAVDEEHALPGKAAVRLAGGGAGGQQQAAEELQRGLQAAPVVRGPARKGVF